MDAELDNILDIAPEETRTAIEQAAAIIDAEPVALVSVEPSSPPAVVEEEKPDPHAEELNDDMQFAREQLKQLIDDGRSALNGIMELAAAGDQPRAYEVVATVLTAVVAASKELVTIHKTRKETLKTDKEAKAVDATGPGTVVNNFEKAVFVGRAQDLLRELQVVKRQTKAALADKSD